MNEQINSAWADALSFCLHLKKNGLIPVKIPDRKTLIAPLHSMPDDLEYPKDFFYTLICSTHQTNSIKIP